MPRRTIGEFEHLVLIAILRLSENAYGASIIAEVEERTGRTVNQAAAYLALRRLVEKGWIEARMGEPTPIRGGRAKRYFTVLPEGRVRLATMRTELMSMWEGLQTELEA